MSHAHQTICLLMIRKEVFESNSRDLCSGPEISRKVIWSSKGTCSSFYACFDSTSTRKKNPYESALYAFTISLHEKQQLSKVSFLSKKHGKGRPELSKNKIYSEVRNKLDLKILLGTHA